MWPEISRFERANRDAPIDSLRGIRVLRSVELSCIHVIDQLVIPNGYSVFRNSTVVKVVKEVNSGTWALALQLKGFLPPAAPELDLRSMKSCLGNIHKKNIFVSAQFEFDRPDVAYLGEVVDVGSKDFRLRCISPSGRREREPKVFNIADCTRIDFFGHYEIAIQLSSLFLSSSSGKTRGMRSKRNSQKSASRKISSGGKRIR